ncbi:MAG TPA: adenosine deaminase, partial [Candidatus Dormibacteraeota bacterium]|nr:adenosine deaminase [Candidatus Dormibacteraeota bacterium]
MLDWEEVAKAELHVHLFGAIQSAVLLELARRNRVHLPVDTIAGLHEGFRFRDFDHFSEVLRTLRPCVQTAEDLELITYEAGRDLAAQHVRYAEVMVTPMGLELRGIRFPASLETMNRARARVRADFGLELRWIFDFNRSVPDEAECRYWADYATEVAIAGRDGGVVALGLSGAEDGNPPEQFAPWFERARAA